jgi:rubrerythrin
MEILKILNPEIYMEGWRPEGMKREDIERLLRVEELHTAHFREWAKAAREPLSKAIFTMAADKEENHIKWLRMLSNLLESEDHSTIGAGLSPSELEVWLEDEKGEGDSYGAIARRAKNPVVKHVLQQMASDETSNAEMIRELLSLMSQRAPTRQTSPP